MTDTLNWDKLGKALSVVLFKYNLDLSRVGKSQRLDYEDFEQIFYHLFLIIDPAEVRRKFWSTYPTRSREEQSKFIGNAVLFINDRQLNGQKISASQLRMCGGEPFRRLLGMLIEKAAEVETTSIEKKTINSNDKKDLALPELLKYRDKLQTKVLVQKKEFQEKLSEFNSLEEMLSKLKEERENMWRHLNPGEEDPPDLDKNQIKVIYKSLLDRLEASNSRSKAAVQQINEIPLPKEISSSPKISPRRVSNMVREMREFLSSPGSDESNLADKIKQKLIEYDDGMDDLVFGWRDQQEKADEALLENPDMLERYEHLEKLIPLISLPPIGIFKYKKECDK